MRPTEKAVVQQFIAPRLLLYVFADTFINGRRPYEAAPVISDTGIEDNAGSFTGMTFALKGREVITVGKCYITLGMMERRPCYWDIEGGNLPSFPFFLTDDSSQRIILDRTIEIEPSQILKRWSPRRPFAASALGHYAVLCPIIKRWLWVFRRQRRDQYRMIVIGQSAAAFPDSFELSCEEHHLGIARLVEEIS